MAVATLTACVAPVAQLQETAVEERRRWVADIEAQDFDFWRRYFDRFDRQGVQFPQPDRWYRPAELVEGAEGVPWRRAAPTERTISDAAWQRARDWAQERRTGALLVARGGVIEREFYADGVHAGQLLAVRSLIKSATAVLYGVAIDKGLIESLDDPVRRYLSEWREDARGEIRIRQLLTYSSGLEMPDDRAFAPDSKSTQLAEGSNVNATALSFQLQYLPDSGLRVNNADSQIAGLILERVSGKRFANLLSEWLWQPIGAGTATVNLDGVDGDARSFCCMRGRALDWLSIGQLFLDGGIARQGQRVVSESYLRDMRAPSVVNSLLGLSVLLGWTEGDAVEPAPNTAAFLVVPQSAPFSSEGIFYLLGGRSISLWIAPAHDLVVFRWGDDPPAWDNAFIVNTLIRGMRDQSF